MASARRTHRAEPPAGPEVSAYVFKINRSSVSGQIPCEVPQQIMRDLADRGQG
jgi:hypothetical protein